MNQQTPPAEPFEKTSNVAVCLVVIALMIIAHYCAWQFDHKYHASTGIEAYFEYVVDICYNWVLTKLAI